MVTAAGDYFTKWVEAYAIPNQEAGTVAKKLVDELFYRFSPPEQLHSDQGRQFTPFFLMFGRQAKLPVDLMYGSSPQEVMLPVGEYVQNLQNTLQNAYALELDSVKQGGHKDSHRWLPSSAPQPEQLGEQLELLDAVDMEPLHKAENGEPAEQVEDLGPHPEVENREHLEEIPVVPGPPVVHAEEPPATLVAQENHQTAFKRRGSSVMENYMHVYIMPCTSETRQ
eukprot:Em0023g263a